MFRFPTSRLSIALIAQVVFCLVAAPVIAAQQSAVLPDVAKDGSKAPHDTGVTIQAAFDASNVRPEEVSDAEQKKGRSRGGINRTGGYTGKSGQKTVVGSVLADALPPTHEIHVGRALPAIEPLGGQCPIYAESCRVRTADQSAEWSAMRTLHDDCLRRPLRDYVPAIQPTGPPAI